MKISDKGAAEIAEHEGIVLGPYLDSVNVWTYGVGHTAAAGGPNPGKMTKVDTRSWGDSRVMSELVTIMEVFADDLESYSARVDDAIKVPLKQHQFDALGSFDLNTGGIYRAKLTAAINAGDFSGDGFMGWLKPKEIFKRRLAEQTLFRTGNYEANGSRVLIYDALGNGRIRYRTTMDGRTILARMRR